MTIVIYYTTLLFVEKCFNTSKIVVNIYSSSIFNRCIKIELVHFPCTTLTINIFDYMLLKIIKIIFSKYTLRLTQE